MPHGLPQISPSPPHPISMAGGNTCEEQNRLILVELEHRHAMEMRSLFSWGFISRQKPK